MGALALTGQPPKRTPFEPLTPGVAHVPYGDVAALDAAVDADTAAVFLEPILGEAGAVTPPDGYLPAAREITAARGALLVLDEVQTGIGRTGALVRLPARPASSRTSSRWPRASAAGCRSAPASASARPATLLEPGQHGTTFGGNPVCCAAALAVLRTIADDGLLEHVTPGRQGASPPASRRWATRWCAGVDGAGLLHRHRARPSRCRPRSPRPPGTAGSWSTTRCPDRVRLAPPLVLTEAQAGEFLAALPAFLDAALPMEGA